MKKIYLKCHITIIEFAEFKFSYCRNDTYNEKLSYKLRDKYYPQKICRETDEAFVTRHWFKGFPVMSNDRNGKYDQIVYLPFNRQPK